MRKIIILFALTLFAFDVLGQSSKNVLFIGNSYTAQNSLPVMTQDLAASLGDNLTVDSNTPGGYTFNGHSTNSTTLTKIAQGGWDYVILQEQSQIPSFPPSQVATDCYPYAEILVDSILSANACTIPLFYMTWGRENGDQSNCGFYPPLCTYDGMQDRLRTSYLEMGQNNQSEVSPVGAAWQYVRDNHPAIDLYSSDGSHPSIYGSYLAACVHYSSIFKKSPVGATYTSTLNASDALILQTVAEMIVIDSTENWNFGVRNVTAAFSNSIADFEALFSYLGSNGTDFTWDFGDGNTSSLENPSNTFLSNGTYMVELIATDGCTTDTTSSEVVISVVTAKVDQVELISRIKQNEGKCTIEFSNMESGSYYLYNTNGQAISKGEFRGLSLDLKLPQAQGYYILTLRSDKLTQTVKLVR